MYIIEKYNKKSIIIVVDTLKSSDHNIYICYIDGV